MSVAPHVARWLAERGGRTAGRGPLWTALVLTTQLLVALTAPSAAPPPPPPRLALSAQVVVQPPLGQEPGAADSRTTWPPGSRVQLTFEAEQDGWTAALWISGDRVVPLYPNRDQGQEGWTTARPYAVPGDDQWLRLAPTPPEGDLLLLVSAAAPVPWILDALDDPSPARVAALRALARRSGGWGDEAGSPERYLPTADGRAVAVPWRRRRGQGVVVLSWTIRSDPAPADL